MEGERNRSFAIELGVIFCILISLGFPGNLQEIFGKRIGTLCEYGAFGIEILVMLIADAPDWQDIKIIRLSREYATLYLYALVVFLLSMLATCNRSEQAISCVRLTVTLFFAIWLQEQFRVEEIVRFFGLAQAVFLMATVFALVRYPGLTHESGSSFTNALRGLCSTKNTCANELVFGAFVYALGIFQNIRRKQPILLWTALFFLSCVLILMCQATGAVFCLLLSLTPLLLYKSIRFPLGLGYVVGNIVFLIAMLTLMPLFEDFFYAIGKDATLTGRIPLWRRIIEVMTQHRTMIGYGYGMFWRDPDALQLIHSGFTLRTNAFMATMSSGAHNVLLEMWLNTGLIGIASFFIAVIHSFRRMDEIEDNAYLLSSMIVIFLLMNGLTERCLVDTFTYKMVSVFLAMALCCNPLLRTQNTGVRANGGIERRNR